MIATVNTTALANNVAGLIRDFGQMQQRQVPYALRQATNATVRDAAEELELRWIGRSFRASPRGLAWIRRHVKALHEGSVLSREYGTGKASVAIIPPGGAKLAGFDRYRGSLVAMMERGGATPGPKRFGGRAVGAGMSDLGRFPVPVRRPGVGQPYPLRLYPINLGLSSRTGIAKRTVGGALKGKHRTFLVPIANNPGHSMVLQRFGKQRDDVQHLFWVQRETRIPARPFFFANVERSIVQRLGVHFPAAMQHALWNRGAYTG